MKKIAPTTSGNQPPWNTLVRLAAKNVSSTVRNSVAPGMIIHSGLRQAERNTTNARQVLVAKIAESAIP